MVLITLRAIEWTFRLQPMKRVTVSLDNKETSQQKDISAEGPVNLKKVAVDALDLTLNLRGVGWDWSRGRFPPFNRSTESRPAFLFDTVLSLIVKLSVTDILQYTIQAMSPSTFGSIAGGTIFDPSLPPLLRYSRSSLISLLGGAVIYFSLEAQQELLACIGVIIFRQHPTQWPPLFYKPWRSTSLAEFWGKRWHQAFKPSFIAVAGNPLSVLFGRAGQVLGVFLMSGLLHDISLWGMGRGTEFWSVGGFFLMMAVGVILEDIWKSSGRKVNGVVGWVWTMGWTIGWANMLVDAWYKRGVAGCTHFTGSQRPVMFIARYIFGRELQSL